VRFLVQYRGVVIDDSQVPAIPQIPVEKLEVLPDSRFYEPRSIAAGGGTPEFDEELRRKTDRGLGLYSKCTTTVV
jgi:hypothetical protein